MPGTRGYGRFYTLVETSATEAPPDFVADPALRAHDTVLLEWTAGRPEAATYDGGPPREILRIQQPHFAHNGGLVAFRPAAMDADHGLLYVAIGDGGRGSDPQRLARDRASVFGKILRIDPLGTTPSRA